MTKEEAKKQFSDITEFESPLDDDDSTAKRFVDDEMGIIIYAIENTDDSGGGIGLTSITVIQRT